MNEKKRKKEVDQQKETMWKDIDSLWEKLPSLGTQEEEKFIPAEKAEEDRMLLASRLALLHLAYGRVLIERFGEEEGRKLILEAIRNYSSKIAEKRKKGIKDLPDRMFHKKICVVEVEGEKRMDVYGCQFAKECIEQGEAKLGALYCYTDPCSSMLANPKIKLYHTKNELCGDGFCEMRIVPPTEQELKDVREKGRDYSYINPVIMKCQKS